MQPKKILHRKTRNHNGFWAFSYPDFQVQTKRYFSLLRGLELPTPLFQAAFKRIFLPKAAFFRFRRIFSKRSSPTCSEKRFALHFGANLFLSATQIISTELDKSSENRKKYLFNPRSQYRRCELAIVFLCPGIFLVVNVSCSRRALRTAMMRR